MDRATEKWSDEEVKALLAIYASEDIQRGFEGPQRNIKIFATVSSQLEKAAFIIPRNSVAKK